MHRGASSAGPGVQYLDTPNLDAFGRLRISSPESLFDCQFTYTMAPLVFEQITAGSGATQTYDSTNRCCLQTFSSTSTGGKAYMQSFQHVPYQPGKSQLIRVTFNFMEPKENCLKFAGYSDGVNGIEFQNNGVTNRIVLYSATSVGNKIINQADWNIDRLNGYGESGLTLDITKSTHLVIDLQALYVGRVRVGFEFGGRIVYAHEIVTANVETQKYAQTVNLPVRCGMTCTGTVSTTMHFMCSCVISEGGQENIAGYEFAQEGTATAGNGTPVHLLSIRPKATFNGIVNRSGIGFITCDFLVTGINPVKWELVLGQAITGTTAFNDVNATYSSTEYNTAGTISGSPAIVIDSGYVAASASAKGDSQVNLLFKYPITLDAAGNQRALGTLSLIVTGIGGTSACRGTLKFKEIR